MTDFIKWRKFLNEFNIPYLERDKEFEVNSSSFQKNNQVVQGDPWAGLSIYFDKDGKFNHILLTGD